MKEQTEGSPCLWGKEGLLTDFKGGSRKKGREADIRGDWQEAGCDPGEFAQEGGGHALGKSWEWGEPGKRPL